MKQELKIYGKSWGMGVEKKFQQEFSMKSSKPEDTYMQVIILTVEIMKINKE